MQLFNQWEFDPFYVSLGVGFVAQDILLSTEFTDATEAELWEPSKTLKHFRSLSRIPHK